MNIRTLVIDDEPIARRSIVRLLREDAQIDLLGECGDGASAVTMIRKLEPKLIFLDIQMPAMSGIEVIAALDQARLPVTVFVTAYERYAVRAFDIDAVDYLVKPFSRERFFRTLDRAKRRLSGGHAETEAASSIQVLQALSDLRKEQNYAERIAVPVDDHIVLIDASDIDWIEANRNTLRLHLAKRSYDLRETMASLEARLNPRHFVRVHRSAIVNVSRIKTIHPWFNGYHMLVLQNGQELRMSRYQHENFLKLTGKR